MTTVLSISGLISQRTVRVGRASLLLEVVSFILSADADLGKFDPPAPRRAERKEGRLSMVAVVLSTADCDDDFLPNSIDRNRNLLPPPPDEVGTSVLGDFGAPVSVGECN